MSESTTETITETIYIGQYGWQCSDVYYVSIGKPDDFVVHHVENIKIKFTPLDQADVLKHRIENLNDEKTELKIKHSMAQADLSERIQKLMALPAPE